MIYRFHILLFLFLAMFWGCESQDNSDDLNDDVQDPCDSTYQTPGDTVLQEPVDSVLIFKVLTFGINFCRTVEEFSEELTLKAEKDSTWRIYNYDFPLAIRLDNYRPGEIIRGSVNLFYLGWTEMDSIYYTGTDRFLVQPEEQLGQLRFLTFSGIEIKSLTLKGKFVPSTTGDDWTSIDFFAEKE